MNPAFETALKQAALTTFGEMCMALPSVEITTDQIEAPFEAEVRVGSVSYTHLDVYKRQAHLPSPRDPQSPA